MPLFEKQGCKKCKQTLSEDQPVCIEDICNLHAVDTYDGQNIPSHPHPLGSQALQGDSNHNEASCHLAACLDEQFPSAEDVCCPPRHISCKLQQQQQKLKRLM